MKGGPTGCREWDDYLVMGPGFALALTIADHFYLGLDSISLLDFREGWQMTRCPRRPFPMGRTGLPETSERGNAAVSGRGYDILFHNDGLNRTLTAHMDAFREGAALDAHIVLRDEPEESMVLSVPFDRPGQFYFSQKIHGMRADGTVQLGTRRYDFHLGDSFGVLDWGRGVWTCRDTWHRVSAAGLLGGTPFGFHLGRGLGDACTATENILFYQGRGHKLSRVDFRIPQRGGRDDFRSPWVLASDDGRFEAVFRPMPGPRRRRGGPAGPSPGVRRLCRCRRAGRRRTAGIPRPDGGGRKGGEQVVEELRTVSTPQGMIQYLLAVKKVKNMNLRVRPDGSVHVSVSRRVPKTAADDFVRSRANWIAARLAERAAGARPPGAAGPGSGAACAAGLAGAYVAAGGASGGEKAGAESQIHDQPLGELPLDSGNHRAEHGLNGRTTGAPGLCNTP